MPHEKQIIPYKTAKGNRPKIEAVIENLLNDDLRKPALEFTNWMRTQEMPFKACNSSSTRGRAADYMKEPICNILVYHENDWDKVDKHNEGDPQYYKISPWLIMLDLYEDRIIEEKLNKIKWDSYRPCDCVDRSRCWAKGIDRTVLNKDFTHICWFMRPTVINPDEKTLGEIKKLLLLEKQARDEYGKRPLAPHFR